MLPVAIWNRFLYLNIKIKVLFQYPKRTPSTFAESFYSSLLIQDRF